MEPEAMIAKPQSSIMNRLVPAVLPVLLVATTYVDPGKWVAAVEGGARFGYDLVALVFVFSLAAVLCHYLAACITVVTGKDLAQICSSEYDSVTCIFLGIQSELSMIALDLSMILGIAHGFNLLFGIGLSACVFLTSLDAFLFPLFSGLLETRKAKSTIMYLTSFALFSYLVGVLVSQPDASLSVGMKFSTENMFAVTSLLGASIMPHNFYLHSSLVQKNQGSGNVSNGSLCNDHLFAIFTVLSGVFVVNYVLMNSAANVFYSTGLDLLTFQDAFSLMDQVSRSPMAPFALVLILWLSNHTTALTWKLAGQAVLHSFFKINLPGWFHHSMIRFFAVISALSCSWSSGAEGTYKLMIFTQILVALLLPSSVIPLFRVATSRSVMGANKVSSGVEFLVLFTFVGMLGVVIVFLVEMVFGSSEWAGDVRWGVGSRGSGFDPFVVLLVTAFFSLSLMLWLVVTPLKSASLRAEYEESPEKQEISFELREEVLVPPRLTTIDEHPLPPEELTVSDGKEVESVEKTLRVDGSLEVVTKDVWEAEESVAAKTVPTTLEVGSGGGGSLSKLGGLGRAARRQLAAVLDEFWGQLFDFHGELTQEARTRKLDKLLGVDSKANPKASKVENQTSYDSSYVVHPGRGPSSLLSTQMQPVDLYGQRSNLGPMDPGEKRYHSLRLQSSAGGAYDDQPATVHGYQMKSYMNNKAQYSLTKGLQNGSSPAKPPGFPDPVVARTGSMQPERSYYNNNLPIENMHSTANERKYYSMPDIFPHRKTLGPSIYSGLPGPGTPSGYAGLYQLSSGLDTWSIWARQPFEQFGVADKANNGRLSMNIQETGSGVDLEANVLKSLRLCIMKLLKLEGSEWLFNQNSGLDEDLVDRVAARERFLYEVEIKGMDRAAHASDSGAKIELVTSIPNCGDGCVWRADLITSFGVWCIHRVLELSLMESRPELWGKYTYVLNRLQGIIELAFSKPRAAMTPCFCLQLPTSYHQQRASPPKSTTSLPPPAKQSKGKCTTAASLLDIVKDVEIAISCRKGRTGTAAGDVAFPKGKENLASVLKRYKRRLSNKPAAVPDGLTGARKPALLSPYGVR